MGIPDVVRSLVSGEIRAIGRFVFDSRMVPSQASYLVADETFVVSDVFGALGGGEIDSVHVHCHRVFSGLFGFSVGGGVSLSTL